MPDSPPPVHYEPPGPGPECGHCSHEFGPQDSAWQCPYDDQQVCEGCRERAREAGADVNQWPEWPPGDHPPDCCCRHWCNPDRNKEE